MATEPLSEEQCCGDEEAQEMLIDTSLTDCALNISHDHEEGENWFCPVDFPQERDS